MTVSRVAGVEAIPLVTGREPGDLDAGNETVLVRVTDEDGRIGVGEADAPARIVRELVEMDDLFEWSRGLRSIVVGLDPFELAANHARMLRETQYHGRRGLGVHAISAVDMALYDLAGNNSNGPPTSSSAVPVGPRSAPTRRSGRGARTGARSAR
jgi:L-alanine-DL-glutamate epimerase-like enolase superfamily enzyme